MTGKDLFELLCICGGFYDSPVFMWYLGTCCGRKGITWVSLGLPKVALKFCVVPVSKWYLGMYFCWKQTEELFLVNFVVLGTYS